MLKNPLSLGLVIPTYYPDQNWDAVLLAIGEQTHQPDRCLIIDSSSFTDQQVQQVKSMGFERLVIEASDFNHGLTRQLAVDCLGDIDIIVFLTQDALLAQNDAIEQLLTVFSDITVGCAYGRQLPHPNATPLARHARLFNYPEHSYLRSRADIAQYGIKTTFLSNSFAAYRVSSLNAVGGFPAAILAEDMLVAAKMLLAGYRVAYCAQACVYHSHNYTSWQEFKRYFDIGVLHRTEPWLLQQFGSANAEGKRFVLSQWQYLLKHAPSSLPLSVIHTTMKWLGYRLGLAHAHLPRQWKQRFSMYGKSN